MGKESAMTVVEINGVKLEVDLRTAVRIDQLKIGSRVKCLVKMYDGWKTCPGVVVGFEPFPSLPTISVAYLETEYATSNLIFRSYNSESSGFEIIPDVDQNALEINRSNILSMFERDIQKKEIELKELHSRREFFLSKFDSYFSDIDG